MPRPDLNLLVTLDVLLVEGSVARAARRLRLSPSAMSRALARLRATTGDPLLVRAGRGLVPTPRATELRQRVDRARAARAGAVSRPLRRRRACGAPVHAWQDHAHALRGRPARERVPARLRARADRRGAPVVRPGASRGRRRRRLRDGAVARAR